MGDIKVGPGSSPVEPDENADLEEKRREEIFSAKIIFSSISYNSFCEWTTDHLVNKNNPNTCNQCFPRKAWSQPDTDDYSNKCDETIFVDCGSEKPNKFKTKDPSMLDLHIYLSWGISRLREIIYRKSQDGIFGTVNLSIIAIHPCQNCMHALAMLLGKSLEFTYQDAPFVTYIVSQPEYRLIFDWIYSYGWTILVMCYYNYY